MAIGTQRRSDDIVAGRGWLMGAGVVSVLLGVAALVWPFPATYAATLVVGTLLIAAGVVAIGAGFVGRGHGREAYLILYGALSLIAGLLIVFFPLSGALTLTMVIAAWLGARGVLELIAGSRMTRHRGATILLGVLNIVFAVVIVSTMPWSALTLPGYLLGISLLLGGISEIGAANGRRQAPPPIA